MLFARANQLSVRDYTAQQITAGKHHTCISKDVSTTVLMSQTLFVSQLFHRGTVFLRSFVNFHRASA